MRDVGASLAALRKIWYAGPGTHKTPDDLARYETLIARVQPTVLVETGLYYGGSARWFAQRVPHVISVEVNASSIEEYHADAYGLGPPAENGLVICGNSHDVYPEVARHADLMAQDGPVMVVLDSDHDTETVYGEMTRYGALVTPGSYMVVEDGILASLPKGPRPQGNWFDGDPLQAIERFLAQTDRWIVDDEIEDLYPTTQSPKGWLRRR